MFLEINKKERKKIDMPAVATVETKVKPTVVANAELTNLLKTWANSDKKTSGFFAQACDYAKKHKLSKPVIEASLKQAKPDWAKTTYASEISRILTFGKPENATLLDDMLAGRKTVTQARAEATKKQLNRKKGPDVRLTERINAAAKFAAANAKELLVDVSEIDSEDEDAVNDANEQAKAVFVEQCETAFDEALIRTPIFGAAAPEEGTEEGKEAGEETEDTK